MNKTPWSLITGTVAYESFSLQSSSHSSKLVTTRASRLREWSQGEL